MSEQNPSLPGLKPSPARSGLKIWQAVAFVVLGVGLTIGLGLLWFALLAGSPAQSTPLAQPAPSGNSDVTAQVSQEYINREVANYLTKNPISVLAVGQVSEAVVQLNPDSTLQIKARVKALGRQIDVTITDKVFVQNNRLELTLAQDPKLDGLGVPLDLLKGVIGQVNNTVATQLNGLVQTVAAARDCTTGKPLGRIPTLQTVNLQQGLMVAAFSVTISA